MTRGPTDQQRTVVLGRTGSGKSQFSIALLSTRNFDEMPWIIIDFKGEDLLQDILRAVNGSIKSKGGDIIKHISPFDPVPVKPGLYYMKLRPILDTPALEAWLWKLHGDKRGTLGGKKYVGNAGLMIDEGYCMPQPLRGGAFDVILTQGRSLHIPVIVLYQRPVWMSRFAVAQADFFAVFEQNDIRDLKIASQFVKPVKGENGQTITVFSDLPRYHCLWYDVGDGVSTVLAPAPDRQSIINLFKSRLMTTKERALV